ncbi:hypothetical protein [Mycolicibacterium mengxianglii]|uniref:hypothetical protein n=1 Tax=Mycolicibacterium mengxianglii TaxID=2736649 RepID=UPI0018D1DD60|nr:hypothetical protein [Mycolicibacterium mengxianglii]
MDSSNLFSHPYEPEPTVSGPETNGANPAESETKPPVFSDLPSQNSHSNRPSS